MNAADLHRFCLSFAGTFEDFPFGPETSTFKVRPPVTGQFRHEAKIFAIVALPNEPLTVSLKCEPALAGQLRSVHPEITGGFHLNKKHWNSVVCNGGLGDDIVRDLIEDSYDLVVSTLAARQREALGWSERIRKGAAT